MGTDVPARPPYKACVVLYAGRLRRPSVRNGQQPTAPPRRRRKHRRTPACRGACASARARLHGVVGEQLGEAPRNGLLALQAPPGEQQQLGARGPDQPQRALRAYARRPAARLRALRWTL